MESFSIVPMAVDSAGKASGGGSAGGNRKRRFEHSTSETEGDSDSKGTSSAENKSRDIIVPTYYRHSADGLVPLSDSHSSSAAAIGDSSDGDVHMETETDAPGIPDGKDAKSSDEKRPHHVGGLLLKQLDKFTFGIEEVENDDDSESKGQSRKRNKGDTSGKKPRENKKANIAKPGETAALAKYAEFAQRLGFGFIEPSLRSEYGLGRSRGSNTVPFQSPSSSSSSSSSSSNAYSSATSFFRLDANSSSSNNSLDESTATHSLPLLHKFEEEEFSGLTYAFERLEIDIKDQQAQAERDNAIYTRVEMDQMRDQDTRSAGFQREQRIRESLDSMGLMRTKLQRQFHDLMILANAKWIHGDDFETDRIEIMERNGIDEIRFENLVITPRRNGKTTMVAMGGAALIYHIPGFREAIFSTGRRASVAMMDLLVTFVLKLPNGRERIIRKNQEQLRLSAVPIPRGKGRKVTDDYRFNAEDETTSVVMSLPSSETGKGICVFLSIIKTTHTHTYTKTKRRRRGRDRIAKRENSR